MAVLAASVAALFVTPALLDTGAYYRGVLGSEAVAGREGLWAPLSLANPLDLAFLVAGIPLVLAALASRPKVWEVVALVGLGAMTFQSGRNATWLVIFAATPAARWLTGSRRWQLRVPRGVTAILAASLLVVLALGLMRAPPSSAAGERLREQAATAAAPAPILADDINAEALALDGRRVWIANPIDAFDHFDQRLYLDWIAGRPAGDSLLRVSTAVLVTRGSAPERRLAHTRGWRAAARDEQAVLFVRVPR